MDLAHFCADTYLNAVSPTPIHSFLTANYRARVSSKVWRKCSNRRFLLSISEKSLFFKGQEAPQMAITK